MTVDPALVAKGLADRLADIEAARERYSSFAFTPGSAPPEAPVMGDDADRGARDLVVRMLATLGDPANDRVVHRLVEDDATVTELAEITGLPPLATWERVNGLVQVGLARHELEGDRVGLTGAGRSMAELIGDIATRVAEARRR